MTVGWRPGGQLVASLLALLVCAAPGAPARAQDAEATSKSYKALRDQGLHYLRRKQYGPARAKLDEAVRQGGAEDYRTRYARARLFHESLLLELAFPEAEKSVELASGEKQQAQAERLRDKLTTTYAGVTVKQAEEQKGKVAKGYIHLEDVGGLINPQKKEVFRRIRERFKQTQVSLPTTIYLPFGKYSANLAPFTIEKGKTAEAVTFLDTSGGSGLSPWWYVAGGVVVAAGAATAALLLIPEDETTQRLDIDSVSVGGTP